MADSLVVVPADAIPGLLGRGACVVGAKWHKALGPGVVLSHDRDDYWWVLFDEGGEGSDNPSADGLALILHDPADPDVSAAGMARAERALRMHSLAPWQEWFAICGKAGDATLRAVALRDAILAAAGRDAG
jgi:hypothetical protein